jgi:SAM-dependent methyltransferase
MVTDTIHRLARYALGVEPVSFAPERILENPYVAAKRLSPLEAGKGFYIIPLEKRDPTVGLPVPPKRFWEGYGDTEEEYLASGCEHVTAMLGIIRKAGASPEAFSRVLEFGCAAARMLRFFPSTSGPSERWGVDVKADVISWCQHQLSPPLLFVANTTYPHLPFEDNYFDLVYAGSVFTHIADLPDTWFLELRRVLRTGGYAYITICDKHSIDLLFSKYRAIKGLAWYLDMLRRFDDKTGVLSQDYGCFSIEGGNWGGFPVPQVFYDADYLVRRWSPLAKVISVNQEAYGFQTALLLQKSSA